MILIFLKPQDLFKQKPKKIKFSINNIIITGKQVKYRSSFFYNTISNILLKPEIKLSRYA